MEFKVKVWKNIHWKKYLLKIREKDFQLKKENNTKKWKKQKDEEFHTFPLSNALVLDQSKNYDYELLITSKDYKVNIRASTYEDKTKIFQNLENVINQNTFKNIYKEYNEKLTEFNESKNGISPNDFLCCKLFLFQNLLNEMSQKIKDFKNVMKPKPKTKEENELMRVYHSIFSVQSEMEKQFQQILTYTNKYFDLNENLKKNTYRLSKFLTNNELLNIINNNQSEINQINNQKDNENEEKDDESSDDENSRKNEEEEKIIKADSNVQKENIIKNETYINPDYKFLSYNKNDFQSEYYNFEKRTKIQKIIMYPPNIVKEMITAITQNKPSPVYFNEPISMLQKQCEKFYYLNLIKNVGKEKNKSVQLAYIAAFMIGEIFLGLNRNLKPFSPMLGETYEYFDNDNNFRYYAEQVSHEPQITAFIGETPEFALYGDTNNSTSFKILKGAMELTLKNKVHIHIKSTNEHFTYTRPSVLIKGFLKPPLHTDYSGTAIIENESFPENRAEIKFVEESWTNSEIGLVEGKIYNGEEVIYLIKGNWNSKVYLVDNNNKDNMSDLLSTDPNQEYLKNGSEGRYELPTFCYNLNYMNDKLKESLPRNDSRLRKDIRLLEESTDNAEAKMYKGKYEENQKKEMDSKNHKILFFEEKLDNEEESYYIPNGKYWEMKKNGELKNNCNCGIFDVSN